MIEAVNVQNYKSLKDVDVELSDFTVLVGPNNSGKSAFLEAMMYLKSTFENRTEHANRIGDVEYLDHSLHSNRIFHRSADKTAESVKVAHLIDCSDSGFYPDLQRAYQQINPTVAVPSKLYLGAELSQSHWNPVIENEDHQRLIRIVDKGDPAGDIFLETGFTDEESRLINNGVWQLGMNTGVDIGPFIDALRSILSNNLEKIYYITDNRDISDWKSDPKQQNFVGHFGENTVSMLHALRDEPETFNRIKDAISDISSDVADLRADMYGSNTQTELMDADTEELFNIVASGAGLRRLLPIIVQIGAADPGDTILIEEPEISVYPETQERLIEFMLESTRERDIQIILTTHGFAITWKIQNMAGQDDGHSLAFEKEDGKSKVEQYPLDRIPVHDYYGEH